MRNKKSQACAAKSQLRLRLPVLERNEAAHFSIPIVSRANFNPVWNYKRKVCRVQIELVWRPLQQDY
jgi:hypothetical protein